MRHYYELKNYSDKLGVYTKSMSLKNITIVIENRIFYHDENIPVTFACPEGAKMIIKDCQFICRENSKQVLHLHNKVLKSSYVEKT